MRPVIDNSHHLANEQGKQVQLLRDRVTVKVGPPVLQAAAYNRMFRVKASRVSTG